MKLVLIGAGQRGMIYAEYAFLCGVADIAAVADPSAERRALAAERFDIPAERVYADADDLFAAGKLGDAAIIASMDRDHFAQAMKALDLGYPLLLEKPISPDPAECLAIEKKANALGLPVVVCHVLRYSPFFRTLKQIIKSGELGKIVAIQHNENVGNFHIAHSFVRGNWRNTALSSPIIMQKSCHDMDLLVWLIGSDCKSISSYGSLAYFNEAHAPQGSAERCLDCPVAKDCRFDARKAYLPVMGSWPATVLTGDQTKDGLLKAIEEGPYGRCVYRCDNDVCDNQTVQMEFENGVHASFVLSGFTTRMNRTLKIMCEDGEIRATEESNTIEVTKFTSNSVEPVEQRVIHPQTIVGAHGGGDTGLMVDYLEMVIKGDVMPDSAIGRSVESHIMAYAAEVSRVENRVVDVAALKRELREREA